MKSSTDELNEVSTIAQNHRQKTERKEKFILRSSHFTQKLEKILSQVKDDASFTMFDTTV